MMALTPRSIVATVWISLLVGAGLLYGHDEDKGTRIAAGLQASPAEYEPHNVDLVGRIALGADLEIPRPVRMPPGNLLTADLFVAGNYVYIGSWAEVMHVVDISDPTEMKEVARVPTPGPALDVKVEGDLAVIGVQQPGADFGVVIVNIGDPTQPEVLAEYSEPGWRGVHNLFIHEQRAYLAHTASPGITILDISDPTRPRVSGFWSSPDFSNVVHDVSIRDGLALVSDFDDEDGGLVILGLEDPDHPETLSGIEFSTGLHSAWLGNGYVYCNQEFGGWDQLLHVIDVRDPRNPVLVNSFRAEGPPDGGILGPHNPFARDGLLYWSYYDAGLRIFDLSNPEFPVQVGYHPTALAWGAHPHDDGLIYVADSIEGLLAFRYNRPEIPTSVAVAANAESDQPEAFALEQNYPNPFNSGTQIAFSVVESAEVELSVYNLSGQRVATLVSEFVEAGRYSFNWDGKGDAGRVLASGVYVYQLNQEDRSEMRRLMLLK